MKTCGTCLVTKELQEFCKDKSCKDGRRGLCKLCNNKCNKLGREANPNYFKDRYAANKESVKIVQKIYYENNKSSIQARNTLWRKSNRLKVNAIAKEWASRNTGYLNSKCAARRSAKLLATPSWANKALIDLIYLKSARLSVWLGEEFHVDHIVPLVSEYVCGLHCEVNLRILPKSENLSKGNRSWPGMYIIGE